MKQVKNKKQEPNKEVNAFRYARGFVLGLLLVSFFSGIAVLASKNGADFLPFAKPSVEVVLSGNVTRDGKKIAVEKVSAVSPGEVLDWSIVSQNNGDATAKSYAAVGEIPKGTEFVSSSANAKDAVVKYSIDGGSNFSEQPMIKEKQADGTEKLVPAPAKMYTQVRFEYNQPVAPNEKVNANYQVRVK
ncbi:MAG: hypothetical protein ACK5NT_13430 [Pyrinomonadaceae bacterium]